MTDRPYHHGNLRRALLDGALELVVERGPAALSLREVARRAGVSHAAPAHHFTDKTGLLTAIAAQGWGLLADALTEVQRATGDFRELGVAYVVFTATYPGHFAVMRAPELVDQADPDLAAAGARAGALLRGGAATAAVGGGVTAGAAVAGETAADGTVIGGVVAGRTVADDPATDRGRALAAWSLVHGLAVLLQDGLVVPGPGEDVASLARGVTGWLR